MQEVLELVAFDRDKDGRLRVRMVYGNVCGSVIGNVWGDVQGCVKGDVWANVHGYVRGDVRGYVQGKISGRAWQYVETPKERAIRLIREGKGEEAIKVLEEQQ
jgi:outer membrane lipoprotein SlyB